MTFQPDTDVLENLKAALGEVAELVVVDNGSDAERIDPIASWAGEAAAVELVRLETNVGLARALNVGIEALSRRACRLALTLDQDSCVTEGMVGEQLAIWAARRPPSRPAIVAPVLVDPDRPEKVFRWVRARGPWRVLFELCPCTAETLEDVSFVFGSGSLIDIEVLDQLGGFREDLFIDGVDHELCLRAQARGYSIAVACRARLGHRLGARTQVRRGPWTARPTNHSADRQYYRYRNRLVVLKRFGLRFPHWVLFDTLTTAHALLRVAIFERGRRAKLAAVVEGTVDGLLGRMGPRRTRGDA